MKKLNLPKPVQNVLRDSGLRSPVKSASKEMRINNSLTEREQYSNKEAV